MRRVKVGDARQILLTDTVGFIDRLPHQLVAAFHATLEEVSSADLLVHVMDASAGDRDRRAEAVRSVLLEVGAERVPMLEVFNKVDLISHDERERLAKLHPSAVPISARTGAGREQLVAAMAARLAMDAERVRLAFDGTKDDHRALIAELYRHAEVISHVAEDKRVAIEANVPRRLLDRFTRVKVPA
jgi:GTP-binding protein HflX